MDRTNRRQLLTNAVALLGAAGAATRAEAQEKVTASGPFKLAAAQGHAGSPWIVRGVTPIVSKVASADVNGRYALIEVNTPPGRGPELHVHTSQNELFFLLEGSIGILCGSQKQLLKTGDMFMAPMNVPHAYVALSTTPARILNLFDPAGEMEQFFASYVTLLNTDGPPNPTRMAALYAQCGMNVVGPPLTASTFNT